MDFAYAIHTEVGHRTIGARVNGRLVALESTLDNGDTVEIFTSKAPDAAPSRDWLGFVKSARARNKIRHWFSKERREAAAEAGKTAIARTMRKQELPLQRLATGDALQAIATELRYPDVSALYAAVGEGHVSAQSVVTKLVASVGGAAGAQETSAETTLPTCRPPPRPRTAGDSGVVVGGRRRRVGQAVPLLHAGARGRDHRVRHPGPRRFGAPVRLRQPAPPARLRARAAGGGALVADRGFAVPGGHPGGGARPHRPAVRRHPGHLRRTASTSCRRR